jgi:sulfite reductase (ferredoxin)
MTDEKGPSGVERLKEASRGLRGPLAEEVAADTTHFSKEGAQLLKFHGAYQQEDRDLRRQRTGEKGHMLMVRCKMPGGALTAEQYLVLDDLAGRYCNATLRVTTRQDNQFHGVLKGNLKATIRALNDALITTFGACGDVERNVVSCPAPVPGGLRAEVLEIARRISDRLLPRTRAYHEIWLDGERVTAGSEEEQDPIYRQRYLPRKFKTGMAFPDDNCTDVLSNDLGFLVIREGDRLAGFNVLVGGGLGMTHGKEETYPRLADPLGFATPDDVVDVAVAVVTVQRDYGNRSDRRRARLKYLLDERGLDWFRAEVEARLGRKIPPPAPVEVTGVHDHLGWHKQGGGRGFYGLFIENGRIKDTEQIQLRTALRRVVATYRPGVHFTPQQNVLLTNIPNGRRAALLAMLADHGVAAEDGVSTVRRWSMACPAMPTCGLAIAEAERALPGVIDELEREIQRLGIDRLWPPFTVRMTGCPNGCARPYTADLAFVGRALDKYTIFVGGNLVGTRLAAPYADLVPRGKLVATVLPLLERYRDERLPSEGFGDFVHRTGLTAASVEARA